MSCSLCSVAKEGGCIVVISRPKVERGHSGNVGYLSFGKLILAGGIHRGLGTFSFGDSNWCVGMVRPILVCHCLGGRCGGRFGC